MGCAHAIMQRRNTIHMEEGRGLFPSSFVKSRDGAVVVAITTTPTPTDCFKQHFNGFGDLQEPRKLYQWIRLWGMPDVESYSHWNFRRTNLETQFRGYAQCVTAFHGVSRVPFSPPSPSPSPPLLPSPPQRPSPLQPSPSPLQPSPSPSLPQRPSPLLPPSPSPSSPPPPPSAPTDVFPEWVTEEKDQGCNGKVLVGGPHWAKHVASLRWYALATEINQQLDQWRGSYTYIEPKQLICKRYGILDGAHCVPHCVIRAHVVQHSAHGTSVTHPQHEINLNSEHSAMWYCHMKHLHTFQQAALTGVGVGVGPGPGPGLGLGKGMEAATGTRTTADTKKRKQNTEHKPQSTDCMQRHFGNLSGLLLTVPELNQSSLASLHQSTETKRTASELSLIAYTQCLPDARAPRATRVYTVMRSNTDKGGQMFQGGNAWAIHAATAALGRGNPELPTAEVTHAPGWHSLAPWSSSSSSSPSPSPPPPSTPPPPSPPPPPTPTPTPPPATAATTAAATAGDATGAIAGDATATASFHVNSHAPLTLNCWRYGQWDATSHKWYPTCELRTAVTASRVSSEDRFVKLPRAQASRYFTAMKILHVVGEAVSNEERWRDEDW